MKSVHLGALGALLILRSTSAFAQEVVRVTPPPAAPGTPAPSAPTTEAGATTPPTAPSSESVAPTETTSVPPASKDDTQEVAPAPEAEGEKEKALEEKAEKGKKKKAKPAVILATEPPKAPEPPPPDPDTLPYTHHQNRWELALGGSALWVGSTSLDLFSDSDELARFQVRAGRTFGIGSRFSFGILPEWSITGTGATSRSIDTSLRMNEFGVGLDGRYHLSHRYLAYVRLTPGLAYTQASLQDDVTTANAENVGFHLDASVGISGRMIGADDGRVSDFRVSWFLEGGWDFVPAQDLTFVADEGSPLRSEDFVYQGLELSAPHVGGGLLLSF